MPATLFNRTNIIRIATSVSRRFKYIMYNVYKLV